MKGMLAIMVIVLLIVGIIVFGIIAYILVEHVLGVIIKIPGVADATVFEKHTTCVLAICSNGVDGKQVDRVGCLKEDGGGNCTMTCRQVADEWRDTDTKSETFRDINGIRHFCGKENYLEFDLDFPITVKSGEIQKKSEPNWVCDSWKLGGFVIPFGDDYDNSKGNCIEFGTLKAEGGFLEGIFDPEKLFKEDKRRIGEACFDGFREVIFTPLMPYSVPSDRLYPSGIYISDSIRENSKDCVISTSTGPVLTGIAAIIPDGPRTWKRLFSNKRPLEMMSDCNIRNRDSDGPKTFRVWSEISINKPYLDIIPGALDVLASKAYDNEDYDKTLKKLFVKEFRDAFETGFTTDFEGFSRDVSDAIKTLSDNAGITQDELYQKINSCALVVVDYSDSKDDLLQFDSPVPIVSLENHETHSEMYVRDGNLNLFFQESDLIDPKTAKFSWIMSSNFIDKGATLEPFLSDSSLMYAQPSVAMHEDKWYLAYAVGEKESDWDIGIMNIDGAYSQRLKTKEDQFAPSIISFDGKLYLFYHSQFRDFTQILYRTGTVSENGIDWTEENQIPSLEGRSTSFPSVSATKDNIILVYSFSDNKASKLDSSFYSSVGVVTLSKNMELISSSMISKGEFVKKQKSGDKEHGINSGFAKVLVNGDQTSMFFDKGTGNIGNENFQRSIYRSDHLGDGKWSRPAMIQGTENSLMASPIIHNGRLVIVYSSISATLDLKMIQQSPKEKPSDEIESEDKEKQNGIESITLSFDPVTGKPTVFSGSAVFSSDNPYTRTLDLGLTVDTGTIDPKFPVSEFPRETEVKKDGTFEFEHTFNEFSDGKPRTFTLTVKYDGKEIKIMKFEAGGKKVIGDGNKDDKRLGSADTDLSVEKVHYNAEEREIEFTWKNSGKTDVDERYIFVEMTFQLPDGKPSNHMVIVNEADFDLPDEPFKVSPGFSDKVSTPITYLDIPIGKVSITVEIDSVDIFEESDESNNIKSTTFSLANEKDVKCVSMLENGDPDKKIDVVFVPDKYDDLKEFSDLAFLSMSYLISVEPFKSNSDKFNFYYIESGDIDLKGASLEDLSTENIINNLNDKNIIKSYSANCPGHDEVIVLRNSDGRSFTYGLGEHVALVFAEDDFFLWVLVHEFSHIFGGLADEYVDFDRKVILDQDTLQKKLTAPNCDIAGCPKWCSGENSLYERQNKECNEMKSKSECSSAKAAEDVGCSWIPDLSVGNEDNEKACKNAFWDSELQDEWYFSSCFVCSASPDALIDYGSSCRQDTGCFLGCSGGTNLWKPTSGSRMGGDTVDPEFNLPSREHLNSLLASYE